ncbi:MAG TPA: ferritin-like domain-containing protein, partial [Terriglobia bacterium]|nr:ferritin-like domain-containing protein [Terriglobia bacterium]
ATARKAADNASADLLETILKDEEEHVDFLETQLSLIESLGIQNYLMQQVGGEEED